MKKLLYLFLSLSVLSACKEDEQSINTKVERLFRQQMKDQLGRECTTVKLTKEKEEQYFIDATIAGTPVGHVQALFLGTPEEGKYRIEETLNSVAGRYVQDFVGEECVEVVLTPKDSIFYDGKITLKTGEKLKLYVHKYEGWYPENDTATLGVLVKRNVMKTQNWKQASIRMIPISQYEYHAIIEGDSGKYAVLQVSHTGKAFNFKEVNNPTQVLAEIAKQTATPKK